jgi:hypothetical protein
MGPVVVHAYLVCSDRECTERFEACGPLEEVQAFACECGCALEIVGWADPADEPAAPATLELLSLAA